MKNLQEQISNVNEEITKMGFQDFCWSVNVTRWNSLIYVDFNYEVITKLIDEGYVIANKDDYAKIVTYRKQDGSGFDFVVCQK